MRRSTEEGMQTGFPLQHNCLSYNKEFTNDKHSSYKESKMITEQEIDKTLSFAISAVYLRSLNWW